MRGNFLTFVLFSKNIATMHALLAVSMLNILLVVILVWCEAEGEKC